MSSYTYRNQIDSYNRELNRINNSIDELTKKIKSYSEFSGKPGSVQTFITGITGTLSSANTQFSNGGYCQDGIGLGADKINDAIDYLEAAAELLGEIPGKIQIQIEEMQGQLKTFQNDKARVIQLLHQAEANFRQAQAAEMAADGESLAVKNTHNYDWDDYGRTHNA